jgi:hypothetical protein
MEASRLCIEDRPGEVNNAVSACDDAVRGDVGRDPDTRWERPTDWLLMAGSWMLLPTVPGTGPAELAA